MSFPRAIICSVLHIDIINNQIASGMSVQMYHESEKLYFSCIFFEHGYLIYYSTYIFENVYVYC